MLSRHSTGMSPPSRDKQEKSQEMDEEPKLSIEEQGGVCLNPALHQEVQEKICKALMCMQVREGNFVQELYFTLFLIYGTVDEIDKQIIKIKVFEENKNLPGIPVAFSLEFPRDDDLDDNIAFLIPFCGEGYLQLKMEVDDRKCSYFLDPDKALVLFADIKNKSEMCLDGTHAYEMRLHDPDLPACISLSLLCKKPYHLRTSTSVKAIITAKDKDGNEIFGNPHTAERLYPANFYNTAHLEKNPHKAGNSLMEENSDKICELLQDWGPVIEWLVTNGRLDKRFLTFLDESPLSEERKGEILRHLYQVENIFPMFVEAVQTSDGGNEELVNFLLQCTARLENQNSSIIE